MSLMNDALRKKKKELKLPPGTDMFKDDSGQKFNSRIRIYGLAALGVLVCALAGYHLYAYISISQPVTQVQPSFAMVEKPASPSGPAPPLDQASGVPASPGTEPPGKDLPTNEISSNTTPSPKQSLSNLETDGSATTPSASPIPATAEQPASKKSPPAPPPGNTPSPPVMEPGEISRRPATDPDAASTPPDEAVASLAAGVDSTAERFYRKGLSYHRQNRLDKAIQMYQAVLKKKPDHRAARFNLASAYIQVGAFDEARTILEELDKQEPGNSDVLLNRAVVEIGLNRPERALDFLDEAGRGNTAPAFEILFHKGAAYSRMGHFEKALAMYQQAERLAPGHTRIWLNKAVVLDSMARYRQAVDAYQTFLDTSIALTGAERRKIELRVIELKTYLTQAADPSAENPPSETEP
jgi:Tfp pilus assembly protein PilF